MKKYIIPDIEILPMKSIFALCAGSDPDGGSNVLGENSDPRTAPQRKVF